MLTCSAGLLFCEQRELDKDDKVKTGSQRGGRERNARPADSTLIMKLHRTYFEEVSKYPILILTFSNRKDRKNCSLKSP